VTTVVVATGAGVTTVCCVTIGAAGGLETVVVVATIGGGGAPTTTSVLVVVVVVVLSSIFTMGTCATVKSSFTFFFGLHYEKSIRIDRKRGRRDCVVPDAKEKDAHEDDHYEDSRKHREEDEAIVIYRVERHLIQETVLRS